MAQLTPIRLEDGTVIYMETTENIQAPAVKTPSPQGASEAPRELTRADYGAGDKGWGRGSVTPATNGDRTPQEAALQNFQAIEHTIRTYTAYTLNAFRQVAVANIDKVTMEFGLKVGGEMGVPYITKGTAESNIKITVECSFPQREA
jgi:hypothetical protein